MNFDQNDPKYYCCCGRWHITRAAKIVAILAVIKWLSQVIGVSFGISIVSYYYWATGAILIPIFIALIYGTFTGKKIFLVPYLVFQVVNTVFLTIILLLFIIATIAQWGFMDKIADNFGHIDTNQSSEDVKSDRTHVKIVLIIDTFFIVLLGLRFAYVIYRCYGFYRDYERAEQLQSLHLPRSQPYIITTTSTTAFPNSYS